MRLPSPPVRSQHYASPVPAAKMSSHNRRPEIRESGIGPVHFANRHPTTLSQLQAKMFPLVPSHQKLPYQPKDPHRVPPPTRRMELTQQRSENSPRSHRDHDSSPNDRPPHSIHNSSAGASSGS